MDKEKKYIDVTKEWLTKATSNNHKVIFDNCFIDDYNVMHPVSSREIMKLANKNSIEYDMAKLLSKQIGKDIHLVPTFTDCCNSHIGTKTPDYLIENIKWDLKTPKYKENYLNLLNNLFKKSDLKLQSECFIIDLVNFPNITRKEISYICKRMFRNKYRKWIKGLIIIKNNRVYRVFIKKRALAKPIIWLPVEELLNVITITLYIYYMYLSIIYTYYSLYLICIFQ